MNYADYPPNWRELSRYAQDMNPDALLIRPMLLADGEQVYSRAWVEAGQICWGKWEPEGVRG